MSKWRNTKSILLLSGSMDTPTEPIRPSANPTSEEPGLRTRATGGGGGGYVKAPDESNWFAPPTPQTEHSNLGHRAGPRQRQGRGRA